MTIDLQDNAPRTPPLPPAGTGRTLRDVPMPGFVKRLAQRLALLPGQPDMASARHIDRLRRTCNEALAKPNKIGGLVAIAHVADQYAAMSPAERGVFFNLLRDEFGVNPAEVHGAYDAYRDGADEPGAALIRLTKALESPRLQLFRLFNTIPAGIKFLVDLRAELLRRLKGDPGLRPMEFELRHLLESWFNLGFLHLERITWDSPAGLLEKLIAYEAVNEISNWGDLKHRLISDRACFAYIHPAMPGEPLIFVEVALVRGMPDNIQRLLDTSGPDLRPEEADTAVFYGITNAQAGLHGIPLGNLLIKHVTQRLRAQWPKLDTFVTLSPLPRFRQDFLNPALENGGLEAFFDEQQAQRVCALAGEETLGRAVWALLERPAWPEDREVREALRDGLLRAARAYLLNVQPHNGQGGQRTVIGGRAACPVAHFHAANGAVLQRINWLGDVSPRGLRQSAGIMVNYLYDPLKFESHQNSYMAHGRIDAGRPVLAL
ncbi:MAG: malonyl-CoA decarboxylase family protein [Candidatus Lambdaproteobacteria bacterium]|nr:malonyl-CoA decarboxylase family protein [Candidatus Lambdaproteobacteria bacterium]